MLKIKIILGSVREGRNGEKFSSWIMNEVAKRKDANYELLDLKDYKFPYYEDSLPASLLKSPYTPQMRQMWADKIGEADGFIIVTPEYNHSYPAALKSALDAIYHEWNNKPISFVSYGSAARGSRAVEHLRLIAVELQMAPIREAIHVGLFEKEPTFNENGELIDSSYNQKLQALLDQLLWWSTVLRYGRNVDQKELDFSIQTTVS